MFSNKRKRNLGGKIFILIIITLFAYGYILDDDSVDFMKRLYSKEPIEKNDDNEMAQKNDDDKENNQPSSDANTGHIDMISNNNSQEKISLDTKFVCKTFNKVTNEIETNQLQLPNELINMTINEAKNYINEHYVNWIINDINDQYIEIYKTTEQQTNEPYFLIKEKNGRIYLYKYNESGDKKMIKETNINFDLLRETDQKIFKNGVIKYDINDVNEILQDFES